MKNLFRIVMAVAVLFTASCDKEDVSSSIGGGEVEVTFTADLGQLGTRAYGEADNVDVVYLGVYEANSNAPLPLVDPEGYPVIDGQASITVVLLKDKVYDLVFWAQNKAQTCYNVVWDERKVAVNYDGVKSQDDARDAFFLVENDFKAGHDETIFKLYRPFAQLNAGLNAKDVEFIGKNGVEISKFKSQVVVKQVATTLNLLEEATDTALDVADFKDVTFALEAKPTQKLNVSGTDYEYLSMNYLLVDAKQNVDLTYTFVDGEGTEYLRPYFSVPVQRNYRTNILGQLISSPLDFNVIIVPDFIDPDNDLQGDTQTFNVSSQAEFEDALAKAATQDHIQHLVINLNADVTLDVTAWQTLAIGNKNTKDITINGSKSRAAEYYTLTFNHKNSDWNNVATNGAKLILESLNITNSGYGATDAPWNRHDINFACDVELNNVVSLNAIALKANAKIENTTINDDHTGSSYAVWIQPNGQTVTIDNCTIDSTGAGDGRGIKIDEQYVDAPEKVVLNVSNTEFVTESKAAIVVKSKAGAEINASNLDIAGVAADTVYAVWVDEDAAAYYDLVEVTGALVCLEGDEYVIVETQDALKDAIANNNATIVLGSGEYTIPSANGKTISFVGAGSPENTVIKLAHAGGDGANGNLSTSNVTFENLTITTDGNDFTGFARCNATYKNCVINNTYFLYGESYFYGCEFNDEGNSYNIWTYGAPKAVFEDCVFNCEGKSIYMDGNNTTGTDLTVTRCIFNDLGDNTVVDNKAAIETGTTYGKRYSIVANETTVNGFAINPDGYNTGSTLWANKHKMSADKLSVTIDGEDAYIIVASNVEGIKNAVNAGTPVVGLTAGTYDATTFGFNGKTLSFKGVEDGAKIYLNQNNAVALGTFDSCKVSFEDLTIATTGGLYKGFARMEGKYTNCKFEKLYFTFHGKHEFINCEFDAQSDEHCMWTYGASNVSFTGCKFNYSDRCVNVYVDNGKEGVDLLFDDCEFVTANTGSKGAVEINSSAFPKGANIDFVNNCVAPAYGEMAFISGWDSANGANATVTINGVETTVPQLAK